MNKFDNLYGIDSTTDSVITFHKNRRMFCINKEKLILGPENTPDSHAVWFEKEGWLSEADMMFMETAVHGYDDNPGIYFYVEQDFQVYEETENDFFKHLSELIKKLKLPDTINVYGGKLPSESESSFPVRKNTALPKICFKHDFL